MTVAAEIDRPAGKSALAFRTISEVAEELSVPQHVLRFWESKFPQIKPVKRGGGRRYYRPGDVELLRQIRDLLYTSGYTIKGVQKLLRETVATRQAPKSPVDVVGGAAEEKGDVGTDAAPSRTQNDDLRELLQELRELRDLLRGLLR